MKKTLLSVAMGLLHIAVSQGQEKLKLGAIAGANYNNFIGPDAYDSQFGFTAGVSFEYPFHKKWSFLSGLAFERKVGTNTFENIFYDNFNPALPIGLQPYRSVVRHGWVTFDYITIPLAFRLKVDKKGFWFADMGTYFSYLHRAEFEVSEQAGQGYVVLGEHTNRIDGGLLIGIGARFRLVNSELTISVRDQLGLVNNVKSQYYLGENSYSPESMQINTITLLVGYSFDLK